MGHSVFFTIEGELGLANGNITGIRLQNLKTGEWFAWDNGTWDKQPKVTIGTTVYIAAYAINLGTAGYMTMSIIVDGVKIATKREIVNMGATMGIESSVDGTNPTINGTVQCETRVEDV